MKESFATAMGIKDTGGVPAEPSWGNILLGESSLVGPNAAGRGGQRLWGCQRRAYSHAACLAGKVLKYLLQTEIDFGELNFQKGN